MADSVIQAPSVSGKPFGPNMDAFLAKVLPSAKSGYVLAVNEYHGLSEYVDNLAKNWSNLSALGEHNVGTLGLERPLYMNVVFWAMQEKNCQSRPREKQIICVK